MNHHGTIPVMTVIRNGKTKRINVTDYNGETDTIPGVPVESSTVMIPDDWESLSWQQLRSLAARVSPTPIHGRAEAVAAIREHLES